MKRLVLMFVLLLMSISLSAQESSPIPEGLLDSSLELVEVYPVVDNQSRTFSVYEDGHWLMLNYPDELSKVANYNTKVRRPQITLLPDGRFLLLEASGSEEYAYNIWVVDPAVGSFQQIEHPCQTNHFSFSEPWVYLTHADEIVLCNWLTGEVSPPLPERLAWGMTSYYTLVQPDISPDNRYLVIYGYIGDNTLNGVRIYSYEIETKQFRVMGDLTGSFDFVDFGGWFTPTIFVMSTDSMPEWSVSVTYIGEVSQSHSLKPASAMLRFSPRPILDPPGFEVMDAVMSDGASLGPCFIEFFDIKSLTTINYDTGDLCEYGLDIPDGSGDRLYRSVFPNAAVVRFNYRTGVRRNVFIGEVENLGEISPDGRFGLIALGNSGLVDTSQDHNPVYEGPEIAPTEYVIMNLDSGNILGRVPASVKWLSSSWLYNDEWLYALSSEGVTLSALPGSIVQSLFPASEQVLMRTGANVLSLYNLPGDLLQPVATLPEGYEVEVTSLQENTVRLIFYPLEDLHPTFAVDVLLPH